MPSAYRRAYRDDSSDDETGFVDDAPYSAKHDTLSGVHEEERDAEPNHVGLQRTRLKEQSAKAAVKKLDDARALEARYAEARALHDAMVRKERDREEHLQALRPHDDRPTFTTLIQRTALEDVRPTLAPSESRVDDLKQPWTAPQQSMFLQTGPAVEPMRFDGGRGATATKFESVFAEKATDKAQREAEEKRLAQEAWQRKVVVDDPKFKLSAKQRHEKPHAIDKHRGLLEGEPHKHSLRKVHLQPAPVSIREVEKLAPNELVDPKVAKHPDQRRFYYAKNVGERLPKIPGMPDGEKQGPLWYEPPRFKDSPRQ
jgi:hypothetical protein